MGPFAVPNPRGTAAAAAAAVLDCQSSFTGQ